MLRRIAHFRFNGIKKVDIISKKAIFVPNNFNTTNHQFIDTLFYLDMGDKLLALDSTSNYGKPRFLGYRSSNFVNGLGLDPEDVKSLPLESGKNGWVYYKGSKGIVGIYRNELIFYLYKRIDKNLIDIFNYLDYKERKKFKSKNPKTLKLLDLKFNKVNKLKIEKGV